MSCSSPPFEHGEFSQNSQNSVPRMGPTVRFLRGHCLAAVGFMRAVRATVGYKAKQNEKTKKGGGKVVRFRYSMRAGYFLGWKVPARQKGLFPADRRLSIYILCTDKAHPSVFPASTPHLLSYNIFITVYIIYGLRVQKTHVHLLFLPLPCGTHSSHPRVSIGPVEDPS